MCFSFQWVIDLLDDVLGDSMTSFLLGTPFCFFSRFFIYDASNRKISYHDILFLLIHFLFLPPTIIVVIYCTQTKKKCNKRCSVVEGSVDGDLFLVALRGALIWPRFCVMITRQRCRGLALVAVSPKILQLEVKDIICKMTRFFSSEVSKECQLPLLGSHCWSQNLSILLADDGFLSCWNPVESAGIACYINGLCCSIVSQTRSLIEGKRGQRSCTFTIPLLQS